MEVQVGQTMKIESTTTITNSSSSSSMNNKSDEIDKPPKWQLDLLMEKLRQKSVQLKPLVDTSKNIRQALMERRCIIDQNDKANLQKSLDSLQQSLRVNSLQSMVERLEMVARQLGLRFTPGGTGHEWFIHSDMFYLELVIDSNGMVEDVKIQHEGKTEQQSCPEIVESLKKTDFQDFTAHLEGLVSIYQLTADKKIKSKAYIALQCLEADLASISSTYSTQITDVETVIMKSLLGLLQPRKGGHPVKLVYFISPYEFLDVTTKSMLDSNVNTVLLNKLGNAATIHIQASSSHKLQMSTTVSLTRTPDGKSMPRYGMLNATNSTVLPACFVLNLSKPVPICVDLLKVIHTTTEIDFFDLSYTEPILNLITHQLSNGTLNCSDKGLFVALPDQVHCYFMTETPNLEGLMVSSICFTLASQLPQVIAILRQQVAFNTLVGSCVRVGSKPELDHIVFEVNALSHQKLAVTFQHPLDDSLVTLEFDLRDVTHPHCHLHAVANATDIIPTLEEHACKVVKRSMSIPITLRAVIRRWQSMKVKADPPNPDFSVAVGGNGFSSSMDMSRSCGAESAERSSRSSASHHQNVMIPPGILNFNNTSAANTKPPTPLPQLQPTTTSTQASLSSASYSISPINNYNNPNKSPQSPMDILSYMNPFMNLPNLPNSSFPNITPNMAMQMFASQMSQNTGGTPSQMLMGLLDQVGQTQKRRKRKNTTDNLPSPSSIPNKSISSQQQQQQQQQRPNQSPSRTLLQKSPIRRQSDSSDGSSGADNNTKTAISMLMSELGMDQSSSSGGGGGLIDQRWNIDITPVNNTSSESIDDLDSFKKQMNKKTTPKRSMSLDSHSSEDITSIQSLIDGQDFKPLVTPSLSITPVSTTTSVNSLLASIRPGIEIIPLPNHPVSIPTSLTVTPIMSGSNINKSNNNSDKQQDKLNNKKQKDRILGGPPGKRKFDNINDADNRPTKLPFLDSKGRISPNISNLTKKLSSSSSPSSSPNYSIMTSPSKQVPTSLGKPSVSTLKSVSSTPNSPKFGDNNNPVKQKINKNKSNNPKAMKSFMGNIPQLKALSPSMVSSIKPQQQQQQQQEITSLSPSTIGGSMESPRTDVKLMSQAHQAAVTAALQQAAASLVANAGPKPSIPKKVGLAAVIDKLKSVHSSTEIPLIGNNSGMTDKKESSSSSAATTMSAKDYLKVSTAITNDVLQQKKALTANSTTIPGGQEYMVKGGQGLKLTINKAKLKDPTKSIKSGGLGLKSPGGIKKGIPGMKPLSHLSALSSKLLSVTKKPANSSNKQLNDTSLMKQPGNNNNNLSSSKVKEDLTKKLFSPGSVKSLEAGKFSPVFDPNKFQIPKKARNTNNNGSSSSINNSSSENNNNKASSSSLSIGVGDKDNKDVISSSSSSHSNKSTTTPPPTSSTTNIEFPIVNKEIKTSQLQQLPTTTSTPVAPIFSSSMWEVDDIANSVPDVQSSVPPVSSTNNSRSEPPAKQEPDSTTTSFSEPFSKTLTTAGGETSNSSQTVLDDFASPESPDADPVNLVVNTSIPQTIPTTPVNPIIIPNEEESPTPATTMSSRTPPPDSPPPSIAPAIVHTPVVIPPPPPKVQPVEQPEEEVEDEDRLVIDDYDETDEDNSGDGEKQDAPINYKATVSTSQESERESASDANVTPFETMDKVVDEKLVKLTSEMPPPPAPMDLTSNNTQPPASPKAVSSPLSGGTTMSIASVHIVHSPQPNSPLPALLRSPLVQITASPAASPYQIDDDLMDEALIGGSSK